MQQSRRNFKSALDFCKRNELKIKNDNIANSFIDKNKKQFWKTINNLKKDGPSKINIMDNETDPKKIANIFSAKYRLILDDKNCQVASINHLTNIHKLNETIVENRMKIYPCNVLNAIDNLNVGLGWDLIHSNHIKLASTVISNFISKLFSSWIVHSHVPESLMFGEIRPIIKDKLNDKYSSENYRPVMSSSVLLKLFDYCLL